MVSDPIYFDGNETLTKPKWTKHYLLGVNDTEDDIYFWAPDLVATETQWVSVRACVRMRVFLYPAVLPQY